MTHANYRCSYSNIPELLEYYSKVIQRFVRKKILCKNIDVL